MEGETTKVFELAKELGIAPLALVDKLRELKLEVKNHMSDLTRDQVVTARTALVPASTASRAAAPKATATRKKSVATPAAAAVTAEPKPVKNTVSAPAASPAAKAKTAPKTTRKVAKATDADEDANGASKSSSTVIRRRILSDGAIESTTTTTTTGSAASAAATGTVVPAAPAAPVATMSPEPEIFETEPAITAAPTVPEIVEEPRVVEGDEIEPVVAVEPEAPVAPQPVVTVTTKESDQGTVVTTRKVTKAHDEEPRRPTLRTSQATPAKGGGLRTVQMPEPEKKAPPVLRRESTTFIAPEGQTSTTTTTTTTRRIETRTIETGDPSAPRRPVLSLALPQDRKAGGLKVVQPAPSTTFRPRGPGAGPGGPRPGLGGGLTAPILPNTTSHRNVRPGRDTPSTETSEEEARKNRLGVKDEFVKPEDVNFGDYTKKQMVFLPKKKKIPMGKQLKQTQITQAAAHKRVVEVNGAVSVQDLAAQMGVKGIDVVRKLMGMGQMVAITASVDLDTATLVAGEFGFEVKNTAFSEEKVIAGGEDTDEQLLPRPPVVTIMGHVDHGKTTLLDSIRDANVAAGEAGGITQHIGAYTISKNDKLVSFIDTPGHEAFTAMRARGAGVTDIVILVVAADDGVMPQTREAISHAKAAGVPIIVAVNKMDRPGANPEKIKQALSELDLLAEEWGGDTMFVPVSALKRSGISELLDAVLLVAEVQNLRANPNARASGAVLEARLDKGRGPVATVLVRRGTLRSGDWITSGTQLGRVKALVDHLGRPVKECTPGMAAEILGFEGVPNAGDPFNVVESDGAAQKLIEHRSEQERNAKALANSQRMSSIDALFAKQAGSDMKELKVILKADVFGSVEAIKESLVKIPSEKAKVTVIHAATGGVTESDVLLASASNAIIIGFNVRPETKARQVAEAKHVDVRTYSIIYELIDDMKKAMGGLLDKLKVEKFLGRAEIRQTFSVPKVGTIAGCAVIDGKILRAANVRLLRDSKIIYDGKLGSLKRFKDDAKEVAEGYECGLGIENFNDLKVGDIVEAYQIDLVSQELEG